MIVNRNGHSHILFFPLLIVSFILNGLVFSAHGMAGGRPSTALVPAQQNFSGMLRILNSLSRNGLELVSQDVQDEVYGLPENFSDDDPLVHRVQEVLTELKQELHLPYNVSTLIKKMNKNAICKIAKEFQFMGMHPTNGSLYLDEEFLRSKKPEAQKLLIKMALKHYLNNTYAKVQSTRFLTATICGYAAYYVSRFGYQQIANLTKNFVQTDSMQTADLPWYSPTQLAARAAKCIITGIIANRAYSVAQYLLDKPVQKYLIEDAHDKIESEFSSVEQGVLNNNRQLCQQVDQLLQEVKKEIQQAKLDPQANLMLLAFQFGQRIGENKTTNPAFAVLLDKLIQTELIAPHNALCESSR